MFKKHGCLKRVLVAGALLIGLATSQVATASMNSHYDKESVAIGDFDRSGIADILFGLADMSSGNSDFRGGILIKNGWGWGGTDVVTALDLLSGSDVQRTEIFGAVTASGDFNNDSYDDVAIGAPNANINHHWGAGAVVVLKGGPSGLDFNNPVVIHQNTPYIPGGAESHDFCGRSLAVGDFNRDGKDDLAIGCPGEAIGYESGAGAVIVIPGSVYDFLDMQKAEAWHQNSPGIVGGSEAGDNFGDALEVGNLNGDGFEDLIIGVPGERVSGDAWGYHSGAIHVIMGDILAAANGTGLSSRTNMMYSGQHAVWGAGLIRCRYDIPSFGSSIAVGNFDGEGDDDIAVYQRGCIDGIDESGQFTVAYFDHDNYGTPVPTGKVRLFHQEIPGVPGANEWGDEFARTMIVGDFRNDGADDLWIGLHGEDLGSTVDAGSSIFMEGRDGYGLDGYMTTVYRRGNGFAGPYLANENFSWAMAVGQRSQWDNGQCIVIRGGAADTTYNWANPGETPVVDWDYKCF